MARLNPKQRRFVEEYAVDFNATQAAIRAGYSPRSAHSIGYDLLKKAEIRERVNGRLEDLGMDAAEATKRLSDWGRGTIAPFLSQDETGTVTINLNSAEARRHFHLLRKVTQTERILWVDDKETVLQRKLAIELHDAKDAVIQVLKIHGKYAEFKFNSDVDLDLFSKEELERVANGESPLKVLASSLRKRSE